MSRVIKAAHVQFDGLALTRDDGLSPLAAYALQRSGLEEMERQAREQLETAGNRAAEMFAEAESKTKLILARAEEQAREYLRSAELEATARAEQLMTNACQQGHQDGIEQGIREGRRQAEATIAAASQVLLEAQQRASQRLSQGEADLVELGIALARRIVALELTTTPEMAVSMARDALAKLQETPQAVLRVCPEMLSMYRERFDATRHDLREIVALELVADPLLSAGDFLIDTPSGTVDGRLDAQLSVLRKALLKIANERSGSHE